jgi:hypothetical protein
VAGFIKELRAGGPMLQVHEEGGMVQASSQQAVVKPKLSSAKTEDVKPKQQTSSDTSSRPLGGKSLTLSEKYYARPSDIFECFVVEGKVSICCEDCGKTALCDEIS